MSSADITGRDRKMAKETGRDLQTTGEGSESALPIETSIRLTRNDVLDLSGLSQDQIAELKRQHASGMIDIRKKAEELKVNVGALDAALGTFTDQTARAT